MTKIQFEYCLAFFGRIKTKLFTLLVTPCFYSTGKKISIIPPLRFDNLYEVKLGHNVVINQGCWIQVLIDKCNAPSPRLIIGNNVDFGMNAMITAVKRIEIGDSVVFGRNVYISDHGHEYNDIGKPIVVQGVRKIKEVTIGAGSWLGNNSIVLPGASIGKNCVIGANSVVNSAIPDYSIAAGMPARIIKYFDVDSGCWKSTA